MYVKFEDQGYRSNVKVTRSENIFSGLPLVNEAGLHQWRCQESNWGLWLYRYNAGCFQSVIPWTRNTSPICQPSQAISSMYWYFCFQGDREKDKQNERDRQMLRTLLLVTFTFLFLSVMLPIRNISFSLWKWKRNPVEYSWGTALYHFGHLCFYTNGAGTSRLHAYIQILFIPGIRHTWYNY